MNKIFLYVLPMILINTSVCVNCSEVTNNQNQEQQINDQQTNAINTNNSVQKPVQQNSINTNTANNNQIQNSNTQSITNILLQKINEMESELRKNNTLIQEQQQIIRKQKEEESEKINKVFNDLKNTRIVAIQHSDGTATITDRSSLNVPRKAFPQHDTTMVPTNIINPTL